MSLAKLGGADGGFYTIAYRLPYRIGDLKTEVLNRRAITAFECLGKKASVVGD